MNIVLMCILALGAIVDSMICMLVFVGVLSVFKNKKRIVTIMVGVVAVIMTTVLTGGGWFFIATQILGV